MAVAIKAVLFDYGNVLCLPQLDSDLESMALCLDARFEPVRDAYWKFRDDFDLGVHSGQDYWTKVAGECSMPVSAEQILRLIELDNLGWTRPNHVMALWADHLRKSGIATAIVSNMPADIRHYLKNVEWLPAFDHYSFSCELDSLKPDAKIYEHTLSALNLHPSNALFIDDRTVNVDAAKALGLESVVFTDAESLHPYVRALGLPELKLDAQVLQR
jgi:putative hydrolase of the HAD superfamily